MINRRNRIDKSLIENHIKSITREISKLEKDYGLKRETQIKEQEHDKQ